MSRRSYTTNDPVNKDTGNHLTPQGCAYQFAMGNDVLDSARTDSPSSQGVVSTTMGEETEGPNPFGVLKELTSMFEQHFSSLYSKLSLPSETDRLHATKLFEDYLTAIDEYVVEEDEELVMSDIQDNLGEYATVDNLEFSDASTSDEEYDPLQESRKHVSNTEVPIERKRQIVQAADQHPLWSWTTLKKRGRFPEITDRKSICRFRKQIARSCTVQKYRDINKYVLQQFTECRKTYKILRASNFRSFAIQKYIHINDFDLNFKASKSWFKRFKRRYKISSRKITRLVSRREIKDEKQIAENAKNFQNNILELSALYDHDHIINTDQCGFNYEITSNRTYTTKGEKQVFGYAQSPTNLCTHSYTVQYIISMQGTIKANVFICLQEIGGKLGPKVKPLIEKYIAESCPNVTLTCSSSGKMNKSLNDYFVANQIAPNVSKDFVCIVDSWSGHTNPESYNSYFGKANKRPDCNIQIIPAKCTPIVQPLDTYFHRQLKYLAREILASLEIFVNVDSDDSWKTRKGVIRLQSLLHFLFAAPIFEPMLRYCWYSAGLSQTKEKFLNAKEVCFNFEVTDVLHCEIQNCQLQRFIKCSHCRKCICLNHLWLELHSLQCEYTFLK